jgi:hypothetical protein
MQISMPMASIVLRPSIIQSKMLGRHLLWVRSRAGIKIAFEVLSFEDPAPGLNHMGLNQFVSNPLVGQVTGTRIFYTSPVRRAVVFADRPRGGTTMVWRPLQVP